METLVRPLVDIQKELFYLWLHNEGKVTMSALETSILLPDATGFANFFNGTGVIVTTETGISGRMNLYCTDGSNLQATFGETQEGLPTPGFIENATDAEVEFIPSENEAPARIIRLFKDKETVFEGRIDEFTLGHSLLRK